MKAYSSRETNRDNLWVRYLAVIFIGLVPLVLGITLRPAATIGASFSSSMMLIFMAGIIFSGLGVYSSVKDDHKGFAMLCLTVGAALIGVPQLAFLL
jgi:hypothetical protein